MKNIYLTLFSIILISCETNWGKYGGYKMDYDSALQYYIVLDKIDTVLENYSYYNKGAYIRFHQNSSNTNILFISIGGMVIAPFVVANQTVYDSTFVLVTQKPLDSICECNEECLKSQYSNHSKLSTYDICKKALKESSYYHYWIIDKKNNIIFGGYERDQFIMICDSLNVPHKLRFQMKIK